MAGYFEDEDPKEKKNVKTEKPLVDDPKIIYPMYERLSGKISVFSEQGYNIIIPKRIQLLGSGNRIDERGLVGEVRTKLKDTRIINLPVGKQIVDSMDIIEDVIKWSDRFIEYQRESLEDMDHLIRSAFKVIAMREKIIDEMRLEVLRARDKMVAQTQELPPGMIQPRQPQKAYPQQQIKEVHPEMMQRQQQRMYQSLAPQQTGELAPIKPQVYVPAAAQQPTLPQSIPKKSRVHAADSPEFLAALEEKMEAYRKAKETKDQAKIAAAQKKVMILAGNDEEKLKVIEAELVLSDFNENEEQDNDQELEKI